MNANDFVSVVLKSPLHAMMGNTMLLTVTGRKTGRKISVPVNYYRQGDSLWIISTRDRTWWRNLIHGAQVDVHMQGHDFKGFGEAILDESAVASQLALYVRRLPATARFIGVRMEKGIPNCEDTARVAKERLFVKVCLES